MKTITVSRVVPFGRKKPTKEKLALVPKLAKYGLSTMPPTSVDYSLDALPCLSAVLGNDRYGDCTCAGAMHELGLWTGNAGALFSATTDQTLALYSAVTGFNPADPSTDQGADETQVLDYLVKTGFPDGSKLTGYVAIDPKNQGEVMQAIDLFETVYFGVGLPDAWISPFPRSDGFIWDVATPDDSNGHCFIATGYNATGVQIDTWGLLGTVTWAAMAGVDMQLYALLSPDIIAAATQKAPAGLDFETLQADLAALNGRGGLMGSVPL
jgi:hypothetical protein